VAKWTIIEAKTNGHGETEVLLLTRLGELLPNLQALESQLLAPDFQERYYTALRNVMEGMTVTMKDLVSSSQAEALVYAWFGLTPEGKREG
jgi:hypothetical protein